MHRTNLILLAVPGLKFCKNGLGADMDRERLVSIKILKGVQNRFAELGQALWPQLSGSLGRGP